MFCHALYVFKFTAYEWGGDRRWTDQSARQAGGNLVMIIEGDEENNSRQGLPK